MNNNNFTKETLYSFIEQKMRRLPKIIDRAPYYKVLGMLSELESEYNSSL